MPQLANITVKKADGTTDVVYTATIGAAGDKSPAVWQNRTVGATPAEYATLALQSRSNGPGTARRVQVSFNWPTTSVDAGGKVKVDGGANFSGSFLIPQNQAAATIKEQAYQFGNLMAAALIKATFEEGYAPRG